MLYWTYHRNWLTRINFMDRTVYDREITSFEPTIENYIRNPEYYFFSFERTKMRKLFYSRKFNSLSTSIQNRLVDALKGYRKMTETHHMAYGVHRQGSPEQAYPSYINRFFLSIC